MSFGPNGKATVAITSAFKPTYVQDLTYLLRGDAMEVTIHRIHSADPVVMKAFAKLPGRRLSYSVDLSRQDELTLVPTAGRGQPVPPLRLHRRTK